MPNVWHVFSFYNSTFAKREVKEVREFKEFKGVKAICFIAKYTTKKRKEVCDDFFPLCFYLFGFFQFLSELQLLEFCVDAVGDFLELLF